MLQQIPQETFPFLKDLKRHNNREWFNEHKTEFKQIEANVKSCYEYLGGLLRKHDRIDRIKVFRIYRDVRFSKNKLPYKTHFGGAFHRIKPHLRGGYYLHLEPDDKSFIGIGFWEPNKEDLFRIRKEFEADDTEIRTILKDANFKKVWGNFRGNTLKTAPRGFNKQHKAIDLIRRKQFIFSRTFTDEDVHHKDFLEEVDHAFAIARPYFNYMSEVLTTNLNGESILDRL